MKLTFISEQDGLKVEMNFEAEFIYDIEDAFKNFLRGSGFTVQDEEDMYTKQENVDTSEECVHEEIEMLKWEVKRANELAEYRLQLLTKMPENKPWQSLTDEEIMEMMNYGQYGRIPEYARNFVDAIEAALRSKNHG